MRGLVHGSGNYFEECMKKMGLPQRHRERFGRMKAFGKNQPSVRKNDRRFNDATIRRRFVSQATACEQGSSLCLCGEFHRKILILTAAVLLVSWKTFAQTTAPQLSSKIADDAYAAAAQSKWKDAIAGYSALVDRGVADPNLYYNLGTAYARDGQKGRAIWMLLKAKRLAPRDGDVRANLDLLAPDLSSQVAVFPLPPLEAIYGYLSLNEWAGLAGAATFLAGLFLALLFWMPKGKPARLIFKRSSTVFIALAVIGHFFAGIKYTQEANKPLAIVVADDAHPRSAPYEGATTYDFVLPPGTMIEAGDAGVKGWIKATYGGRNQVFIRREQMEFL